MNTAKPLKFSYILQLTALWKD